MATPAAGELHHFKCWRAEYSGDAHYAPAWHTNNTTECFTVTAPLIATVTTLSSPTGNAVPDEALTGDSSSAVFYNDPPPTGTVTFFLCDDVVYSFDHTV